MHLHLQGDGDLTVSFEFTEKNTEYRLDSSHVESIRIFSAETKGKAFEVVGAKPKKWNATNRSAMVSIGLGQPARLWKKQQLHKQGAQEEGKRKTKQTHAARTGWVDASSPPTTNSGLPRFVNVRMNI